MWKPQYVLYFVLSQRYCSYSLKSQTTCETTNSTTAKGPSPNKKQKRLTSTPSLGPDDFNLEAVVGKGGFGQVATRHPFSKV